MHLLAPLCTFICACLLLDVIDAEVLKNGDFEAGSTPWNQCWGFVCELTASDDTRFGKQYLSVRNRTDYWMGPGQSIQVTLGKDYRVQSYIKLLNDLPGKLGQKVELEVSFEFPDGSKDYVNAAVRPLVRTSDGWFLLRGDFQAPSKAVVSTSFYYQGPDPGVGFAVDNASVTEISSDPNWQAETEDVINRLRKSDINVRVTTASGVSASDVKIQVVQTRKSYPFGMGGLDSWRYVDPTENVYREWVHQHFNWATPGNMLKWRQLDWHPVDSLPRIHQTIDGLRSHGIKIRAHNMVWSVQDFIPLSILALSGDALRNAVQQHITFTCNLTRGLVEHWDVNNENLHGQWFQERLQDIDYDLELFRMVHAADPDVKLFLNEYNVVAQGAATDAYLAQGLRFKAANVSLYGMGVQTHFLKGQEPSPTLIKERLDRLATVGVPLWVTELSAEDDDPNREADFYERGLRALYGHPAVEGIIFWGFEGYKLAAGGTQQLTPSGQRVLDLLEKEWMTNDTHPLASGSQYTVRGFHGDYELRVLYREQELADLRQIFTLGPDDKTVSVNVHT